MAVRDETISKLFQNVTKQFSNYIQNLFDTDE